ncbi:MAG TPA: 3-hydroxyacyl-CoA dehydrogenase NAD-binding domain-containing protein, partial [Thermoleophilaceae bacterium]|nr:3-hydroxyacyl-CoA dehydrogenase NAD-binding domain-containing protein [Thermoleophilaceae bacterium]
MTVPEPIGVVGAGTMGLGIAQLAAGTGARTLLHDPVPDALAAAPERMARALERPVAKGRMTAADAEAIVGRVEPVARISGLAPCAVVIEAAPERLELKHELFAELAGVVDAGCVLATNTSSLSVTELAAPVAHPERVVGLHFFNPAPVMRLVEVVAGQASSAEALATTRAVGEAMGKRVIDARDIAGFLVNRVNRPFSLESLRLLQEGVADAAQIDRIVRLGAGFRMGPFELMDLIGIDTNHAVAEEFHRRTYGEPRYRPSAAAARMVAAGTLGRKTGSGWFAYAEGREHRPPDPDPPPAGGGDGRAVPVAGAGAVADALRAALAGAGFDPDPATAEPWLTIGCDGPAGQGHRLVLVDRASLHHMDPG